MRAVVTDMSGLEFLGAAAQAPTPGPGAPRRVLVADVRPPAALGLPALAPAADADAVLVSGAGATPCGARAGIASAAAIPDDQGAALFAEPRGGASPGASRWRTRWPRCVPITSPGASAGRQVSWCSRRRAAPPKATRVLSR